MKRELEKYVAQVRTMYNGKDKKIRPANVPLLMESTLEKQ